MLLRSGDVGNKGTIGINKRMKDGKGLLSY
jgi:hypothetical protein